MSPIIISILLNPTTWYIILGSISTVISVVAVRMKLKKDKASGVIGELAQLVNKLTEAIKDSTITEEERLGIVNEINDLITEISKLSNNKVSK